MSLRAVAAAIVMAGCASAPSVSNGWIQNITRGIDAEICGL